jgi:hypothetical protein
MGVPPSSRRIESGASQPDCLAVGTGADCTYIQLSLHATGGERPEATIDVPIVDLSGSAFMRKKAVTQSRASIFVW